MDTTAKEKIISKLKDFVSNAQTRGGYPFKVLKFQSDPSGAIQALTGIVNIPHEGNKEIEILWNMQGRSMYKDGKTAPNMLFDLILSEDF